MTQSEVAKVTDYELDETLDGVGTLTRKGSVIADQVRYHVEVIQEFHDVDAHSSSGRIPGMRSAQGTIDPDKVQIYRLVGEELELVLEDGRVWPCIVQSS